MQNCYYCKNIQDKFIILKCCEAVICKDCLKSYAQQSIFKSMISDQNNIEQINLKKQYEIMYEQNQKDNKLKQQLEIENQQLKNQNSSFLQQIEQLKIQNQNLITENIKNQEHIRILNNNQQDKQIINQLNKQITILQNEIFNQKQNVQELIKKPKQQNNYQIQLEQIIQNQHEDLLTQQNHQKITNFFNKNFRLFKIYKATQNGFQSQIFHQKCDNQGKTLVLIKSEHKQIFGGYADLPWHNQDQYIKGQGKSFIFQLNKYSKHQCINNNFELYGSSQNSINFGNGYDIFICQDSNIQSNSYSNLGKAFELPEGMTQINEQSRGYLGGTYKFLVEEIEVYKIEF